MRDSAKTVDGAALARRIRGLVAVEVAEFRNRYGHSPGLATVLVGGDPASKIYVAGKKRACAEVGIVSAPRELPESTDESELVEVIESLNASSEVNGILVQLPLPGHIDSDRVLSAIDPVKDVDGLTPWSLGRLLQGRDALRPCTPAGVVELLDEAGVDLVGADVVVVGRSTLVGKPLALMLLARHATVTICHSRTRDLPATARGADVLVAAVGSPGLVTAEWVKPGATVVDVGISRTDKGIVGDVDADSVRRVAGAVTPVPGGVGPMTIAMLLSNTVQAARRQREYDRVDGRSR